MPITPKQIELVQEFRQRLKPQLQEYEAAPEEITELLDGIWVAFKEVAEFDDDNQADLAGFGALAQFATFANELEDKDLRGMLSLFSVSVLSKIRKGDRLD